MNRPHAHVLSLAISALLTSAGLAEADVISVCLDGSCDFTTIEAAVEASCDGDTIMIGPGTYYPSQVIILESDNFSGFTLSIIGATDSNGDPAGSIQGGGRDQIMRVAL